MVKITNNAQHSNSLIAELIRDVSIAFAENDTQFILDNMAEDIIWELVGEEVIEGKIAAIEALEKMIDDTTEALTINSIIAHDNAGSINGVMIFSDETKFGFCDVYTFSSHDKDAKITSITSYIVELQNS